MAFESVGFECVFSNDFDINAKVTFDLNFSELFKVDKQMVLGDIQKISTDKIPDFDILCGRFSMSTIFCGLDTDKDLMIKWERKFIF